jgi:membrane protein
MVVAGAYRDETTARMVANDLRYEGFRKDDIRVSADCTPAVEVDSSGADPSAIVDLMDRYDSVTITERGSEAVTGMTYLKRTINEFLKDDCTTKAAALAYYITFSLAPLLLIVIGVAGLVFGREEVQGRLQEQIQNLVGSGAASQIQMMIQKTGEHTSAGLTSTIVGFITLIVGATTAFAQLQSALNGIWHVKPDPNRGDIRNMLMQRLLSFAMISGVAFLLLVSLVISAALAAFSGMLRSMLPADFSTAVLGVVDWTVSIVIITALFAAVFGVLPDVVVAWRPVWVGAALTALLFTFGKSLIAFYLGRSGIASAYGAAGSLVILLFWIYYSSMIVLFGAEFTKVWAELHGTRAAPRKGAIRVIYQELPAT